MLKLMLEVDGKVYELATFAPDVVWYRTVVICLMIIAMTNRADFIIMTY
jgi:hypothetical protein